MSADPGHPTAPTGEELVRRIERLAERARALVQATDGRGLSPDEAEALVSELAAGAAAEDASGLGWWVLAVGRELDADDFAAREAAREELLETVRGAGVLLSENVWVWDESGRAMLVLATLPSLARAGRVAARLGRKGLAVAVRREMPERDSGPDK